MLECGSNFKGTMPQMCPTCKTTDNEQHRLNYCSVFSNVNRSNDPVKSCFNDIYSNDFDVLRHILDDVEKVWEFRYANGRMKRGS